MWELTGAFDTLCAPRGLRPRRDSGEGRICPVIFVGDGRAGKSYLASCLVGTEAGALTASRGQVSTIVTMWHGPLCIVWRSLLF